MVHRDDGVVAGLGDVLQALDLETEEGAEHDREKIVQPAGRHGAADDEGDDKVGDAEKRKQDRHAEAELLQHGEQQGADDHEGGIQHVDGGDDAGAVVGAGPGLHRGKRRHDEQAAGDRQAGEIDGNVNAVRRGEIIADAERMGRRHNGRNRPAKIEAEQAEQHGADQRRQQNDAPGGEPRGETGADGDGDGEDGEEESDDPRGAADVERHQRRQQRQHQRADQPEPARHQRTPPQPRLAAYVFDEHPGGDEDVAVDRQGAARLHRSAG